MPPTLAFIIPAHNAEKTLPDTLRSILDQTQVDILALVIDDGSTDQTSEIARRASLADPRVRLIRQENRGLAAARNRGIAELLSELHAGPVCFLDADDCLAPTFAQRMLDALDAAPDADAAACAYRMVGPQLEDLGWVIRPAAHDLQLERLVEFNPLAVGAVVVRLAALGRLGLLEQRRLGGVPFDQALPVHEDWDLWLRFVAAGGRWAPIIPEPLFSYRLQPGTLSGALPRMHRIGLQVIDRAPVNPRLKAEAMRHWHLRHIARAVARGDAGLTRTFLTLVRPPLTPDDIDIIAGALRWALCQEHRIGPGRITPELEHAWRSQVADLLHGVHGVERIIERIAFTEGGWLQVARALLARMGDDRPGVIYGLGRNGRDLLRALEELLDGSLTHSLTAGAARPALPRLAWLDDNPAVEAPTLLGRSLPRLRLDLLTHRHIVIITPERRGDIIARLAALGIGAVETPQSILRGPAAAPSTDAA